ncbi:MAG: DUF72 domain-containing protein [Candidatus Acidiferrales bacterium]
MAADIRIGTSAFTAAGWEGSFYPEGMQPADYLHYYAQQFDTVEVDSTYYRIPAPAMVKRWYEQTPKNFLFALKIVSTITHEKVLVDCEEELRQFISSADLLGEKLGPLLFQFPYFNKKAFPDGAAFFARLEPFMKKLPRGYRFAVEIRNKAWMVPRFADILRERGVALTLVDHPWMPRPREVFSRTDPITADFTYIRLLGDRKGIEEETKTWDKTIVDRKRELAEWVEIVRKVHERRIQIFVYVNNHYAGHAPATVRQLSEMLQKRK